MQNAVKFSPHSCKFVFFFLISFPVLSKVLLDLGNVYRPNRICIHPWLPPATMSCLFNFVLYIKVVLKITIFRENFLIYSLLVPNHASINCIKDFITFFALNSFLRWLMMTSRKKFSRGKFSDPPPKKERKILVKQVGPTPESNSILKCILSPKIF